MKNTILDSFAFSDRGIRPSNEDSIYPPIEQAQFSNIFLVCDGVGGSEKGEIASELACKSLYDFFNNLSDPSAIDDDVIHGALQFVQNQFEHHITEHPSASDMATTIAMLIVKSDSVIIVHVGDSRVYHLRENKVIFETKDHSLVNSLLKNGQITEEEAVNHPQKNVITKAMQAGNTSALQPGITVIDDIQAGDCFLLCSDGVTQVFPTPVDLENIFVQDHFTIISSSMEQLCKEHSKDNYSAYCVKISPEA